jgi:hypothetical protein
MKPFPYVAHIPIEPSGIKKERRLSTRPVKAPSRDLPDAKRRPGAQLRFCQQVIRDLFHKKHSLYAWPFYKPVDVEGLQLRDYYVIVKKPMDLGSVRDRLEKGLYRNAMEFSADVRLIFTNCYKYNPPDHDVVGMCKKLQQVFEYHMSQMPEDDGSVDSSDSVCLFLYIFSVLYISFPLSH